jgi:TolB-like protein
MKFLRAFYLFATSAIIVSMLSGCSNRNMEYYSVNVRTTSTIFDTVDQISQELMFNLKINSKELDLVAITSFVDLHDLNKTTDFGRVLSEGFYNELSSRGVNVIDFRAQKALSIDSNGEYFLSRDSSKLKENIENKFILVGTYSRIEEGVIINARIIDSTDGIVVSSSRVVYNSGDGVLLEAYKYKSRSINIISN